MDWLPMIIPALLAIAALVYFRKRIAFWEPFVPFAATALLIVFFRYIGVESLTKDTEYWGNYVTSVRWYEEWDEWIERTCTRTYPCGTDSKGNTKYCTETYDCSYREYHPERWSMVLNDGRETRISQKYYETLKNKFGTQSKFVDMDRDYYTIDGDMYDTPYPGTYEAYEFYASSHRYENKVQASQSIFNYPKVEDEDVARYKLYEYPSVKDDKLPAVLHPSSVKVTAAEQKRFDYINGRLGMDKKVRVWVCLFDTPDDNAGFMQEAYWKRGNKNELVTCIGVDKDMNVLWVRVFGWSKEKLIDVEVRDYVYSQKKLELSKFGEWLYEEVSDKWVKTSFEEFEYLSIETPRWAVILTWVLSIVVCIVMYYFWITNSATSTDINGDGYEDYDEDDDSTIFTFFHGIAMFFVRIYKWCACRVSAFFAILRKWYAYCASALAKLIHNKKGDSL